MIDDTKFRSDYTRGMTFLSLSNRAFANFTRSLGVPIANKGIPTAQVQLNVSEERIEFHVNPAFIADLSDMEIAAVLAHETYHVMLDHLSELVDTDSFPKRPVLIDAQECIINDSLPGSVGVHVMDGAFKGPERHNQDFSIFTTQEGYDFILQKQQEEEEEKGDEEQQESGSDGESEKENSAGSGGLGSPEGSTGETGDEIEEASGGCGGVTIAQDEEGKTPAEDEVKKVLAKAINGAIENSNFDDLPIEIQDAVDELREEGYDIHAPGIGVAPDKSGFISIDKYADLNTNWVKLLADINPKIKESGRPKPKDSWHAPRRRMMHSYPKIVLPTRREDSVTGDKKGDKIPSFIIALDMSPSIPAHLLKTLAGFAKSIPADLIKAYPITWSSGHRVFDPENPDQIVPPVGTILETVRDYAAQVKKDTGTEPYVLVITDGKYYMDNKWDKKETHERWYFMGIQAGDRSTIISHTGEYTTKDRVFNLNDYI